jgi:hypothetical protein
MQTLSRRIGGKVLQTCRSKGKALADFFRQGGGAFGDGLTQIEPDITTDWPS